MNTEVMKALRFAIVAHGDQKRKYTLEPYVAHVLNVFELVASVTDNLETLQAALLHDVLEDTEVTLADLIKEFGNVTAAMVLALTDTEKDYGNRAVRKMRDRERIAMASSGVQTIKLADLIDNTTSIVEHDLKFAKVYLREKAEMLVVLIRGDERLQRLAATRLEAGFEKIRLAGKA